MAHPGFLNKGYYKGYCRGTIRKLRCCKFCLVIKGIMRRPGAESLRFCEVDVTESNCIECLIVDCMADWQCFVEVVLLGIFDPSVWIVLSAQQGFGF